MSRDGTSKEDASLYWLALLSVVLGLILVYSAFLKLAGAPGDVITAGQSFLLARLEGRPWAPYEIRAAVYFGMLMLVVMAVVTAVGPRVLAFWKQQKRQSLLLKRYASHQGSAEWGSLGEVKKLLGNDGVIIGGQKGLGGWKAVRLSARYSFEHVAVIGPTGCGKSTCFFIPNLLELAPGASAVVTDPKGELEEVTAPVLRKRGWDVYTFAPTEPAISLGYDPLRCARDEVEISDIADIILRNGYDPEGRGTDTQWINFSAPLFEAVLYAARELLGIRATVREAVTIVSEMDEEKRAEIFKQVGGRALSRYLAYLQSIQSPETAGSIRTILTASVRVFDRPDVAEVACKSSILDFTVLREKPSVLFVRIPERRAHLLKPLTATFFWQLLEHIADAPGRPVYFFLDEFPNIGKIPGFANMAATLRSRGISLCIGLQGVEQLAREYSEQEQKDILNNLKTKIYFPGASGETGQYASTLAGYATARDRYGDTGQRVELFSAAELRTIPEGKILVMSRNFQPLLLDALHYSRLGAVKTGVRAPLRFR
ncbi:Type IV secretory system Conjugative DNA transfer [Thermanaeromonas toyohensis ToBE]|uniref:Type IV secretory system Conjugative DNA transfer n=2 Tax=Thermanaeromonas TaxID=202949 RepID=A0A1W1VU65_9FIRM|nr:Type IV secretory system Conjugative DNA transfer [Thermanaeromonas toyohensis ToBE]